MLRRFSCLAALAIVVLMTAATVAEAVPIINFRVSGSRPLVKFSFRVVSPAGARTCWAAATARLVYYPSARTVIVKRRITRSLNVCQTGTRGRTYGDVAGNFGTRGLPGGRYAVCVTASQRLRSGVVDLDRACRIFFLASAT